MKLFHVDYKRLVVLLLPISLRQDVIVAFLRIMTSPIVTLFNDFSKNRNDNLFRLQKNGQVCYLRSVLNDAFPQANKQIRIEDEKQLGHWQFAWDENYDSYKNYLLISETGTLFWDKSTIFEDVSGFVVYVPVAIYSADNDAKIRSLLNTYKLLSKSYTIVYE